MSSTGVSEDDRLEVMTTLNNDLSDKTMDDTSDWLNEPDEPVPEAFNSAKYCASQPDPPLLAPSVLASLHTVSS